MYHVASIHSKRELPASAPIAVEQAERILRARAVVTLLGFPAHFAIGLEEVPKEVISPMLARLRAATMGPELALEHAASDRKREKLGKNKGGRPRKRSI